jgi:cytochrome P450
MPDPSRPLPLQDLEQLPYLTAVILEGHRISHAASHRLFRVFPSNTLAYNGFTIQAGTTVSMTPLLMHENTSLFPNPQEFRPDRWFGEEGTRLKRFLVPFGKGTRQCIGLNLANAELYLGLATVFRRFEFEFEGVVKERDWVVSSDMVIGSMSKHSPGVIVRVKDAGKGL